MNLLSNHIADINKLCSLYGVRHLYAFGSVLTDRFNAQSDIDLIVDFLPIGSTEYADNYYDLKFSLEKILNKKVDLLEEQAIKNPYFLEEINGKKKSSMEIEIKTWLYDISNALTEIDSFLGTSPKHFPRIRMI